MDHVVIGIMILGLGAMIGVFYGDFRSQQKISDSRMDAKLLEDMKLEFAKQKLELSSMKREISDLKAEKTALTAETESPVEVDDNTSW